MKKRIKLKMKEKMKKYLANIMAKRRKQEGFTLIEMVVVIAIIVILILLIVPNLINQKKNAETKLRMHLGLLCKRKLSYIRINMVNLKILKI